MMTMVFKGVKQQQKHSDTLKQESIVDDAYGPLTAVFRSSFLQSWSSATSESTRWWMSPLRSSYWDDPNESRWREYSQGGGMVTKRRTGALIEHQALLSYIVKRALPSFVCIPAPPTRTPRC